MVDAWDRPTRHTPSLGYGESAAVLSGRAHGVPALRPQSGDGSAVFCHGRLAMLYLKTTCVAAWSQEPTRWEAVAFETRPQSCEDAFAYRLSGLAGILVVVLGFWVVSELLSAARHVMRFRSAGGLGSGLRPPSLDRISFLHWRGAVVDVGSAAARLRRSSHLRLVAVLVVASIVGLVLPGPAVGVFFFLFGSVVTVVVAARDLEARGSSETREAGRPIGLLLKVGPPLFFGSAQVFPVFLLMFTALNLIGLGLMFSYIAGGTFVCHEVGVTLTKSAVAGTTALAGGLVLLRAARWMATRRASDLLASDDRDPVLYLRSFSDDRLGGRTWLDRLTTPARERFEQVITWNVWIYGPVVAIRRPGGSRQPIGAARQELDEDAWMRDIEEWLLSARLICMTLGRTAGLQWEINRIRTLGLVNKLVLLFPPISEQDLEVRWFEFQRNWDQGIEATGMPRPPHLALAAVVAKHDQLSIIAGDRRDEASYRAALHSAAEQLSIQPVSWDLVADRQAPGGRPWPAPSGQPGAQSPQYYIALPSRIAGPYGAIQLRRMAGNRQIAPSTLVTTGHMPWMPVGKIPGIYSPRSRKVALMFALFGGLLGLDRFYLGYVGSGVVKLLTLGCCGTWWLVDLILLVSRKTTDSDGRLLQ
jgi:TM2 domain/GYF domain 2